MLALWDAIGITHELNGYRNDAAGWLKKYGDERELQIGAFSAIVLTVFPLQANLSGPQAEAKVAAGAAMGAGAASYF